MAWWRGDFNDAIANYEACLALRRTQDNPGALAEAAYNLAFPLGGFAGPVSDYPRAKALVDEAVQLWESIDDELGVAKAKWLKGTIAWSVLDFSTASVILYEALPVFRRRGETFMLAWSLYDLGLLAVHEGDADLAREQLSEALRIFADSADVSGYTLVLDAFAETRSAGGVARRAGVDVDDGRAVLLVGGDVSLGAGALAVEVAGIRERGGGEGERT